ncbi:MAG: hypothetical protein JEY71_10150 [Sphaerochaeta sp.]|nr:hypothetical protein [Sphaerochaeta sp.]
MPTVRLRCLDAGLFRSQSRAVSVASTMGKGSTFTIELPRSTLALNDMKAKSDSLYQF